jgi:hypothetical protein
MANGARKNDPAMTISPTANTPTAANQIQRHIWGSSTV